MYEVGYSQTGVLPNRRSLPPDHMVDSAYVERYHLGMPRIAILLASLLLLLTFNAYACVLPLPAPSQMDCSLPSDEPARQTCDAFLELGPHSQSHSHPPITAFVLDLQVPVPVLVTVFFPSQQLRIPRGTDTQAHLSIQTTVLRI